jgi:hypothetical protein
VTIPDELTRDPQPEHWMPQPPLGSVQPGDWFVVDPSGTEQIFRWVELAERIIDCKQIREQKSKGQPVWGHAGIATRWVDKTRHTPSCPAPGQLAREHGVCTCGAPPSATLMIVEAEPGGAVERPWHWENAPHLWSTGTGLSVPSMASAAQGYIGVGYSILDYAAIGAHAAHLWTPGLREYIASTRHQICSQLTDQCAVDKGVHLFSDGRWPGYVTPLDLGLLLDRP